MIEITGLTKIYKMPGGTKVRALDKVELSVEKGEFVAIMGSSGSGKSTLLHIIGGVDTPTSGKVEIDGINVHKMKPSEQAVFRRRKVGIIYQAYNLIPTLTVEENMILPRLLDRRKPKQEEVEQLLELLNLKDRRGHLPGQLSGGQQQRTAIGRILLEKPAVLLADEPTGNLDSANTREILNFLEKINAAGQTILLVTHDPGVGEIARRKLLMRDGKIISDTRNVRHKRETEEETRAETKVEAEAVGRAETKVEARAKTEEETGVKAKARSASIETGREVQA